MTEEEKKRLALEFFQNESERMKARPFHSVEMDTAMRQFQKRQAVFSALSQQGISSPAPAHTPIPFTVGHGSASVSRNYLAIC